MKITTKPTLWDRVLIVFFDYWAPAVVALVVLTVVGTFIYHVRHPSLYMKAPVESCRSTYTGQQKTEGYYTYQCAAYDGKGNCTVQMPIYNEYTYREVNNQCSWNEWR